jgi:hypothetical protein
MRRTKQASVVGLISRHGRVSRQLVATINEEKRSNQAAFYNEAIAWIGSRGKRIDT